MKEEKWVLFPFLTMDYKAAEGWLNDQAAQGWQYTGDTTLWDYLLCLRRAERTDLRYCVDISGGKKDQDYRDFLAQAGWNWEGSIRGMDIFSSLPGAAPVPIQTDADLERQRFGRRYFWTTWLADLIVSLAAVALIVWLYGHLMAPASLSGLLLSMLSSWWGLFRLALLPVFLASILWELTALPLYYFRSRREGLPPADPLGAWRRGAAEFAVSMLIKLFLILNLIVTLLPGPERTYSWSEREDLRGEPVVMAEDIGLTYSGHAVDLTHTGTPLVERWEYRELAERTTDLSGWLLTDRYRCLSAGLASWATQALMEDGSFAPADLGFDESWVCQPDGVLGSYVLVLREENTVVRLEGPVDFTDPAVLAMVRARLGWEAVL